MSVYRRRLIQIVAGIAEAGPARLNAYLAARVADNPRCPVSRYLLGCLCLDRRRPATAVQHMMIAHHAEPALRSAALLAFAGLNWVSQPEDELLPVLLATWEEFRRPAFDQDRRERLLLDAFAEPDPGLEHLGPLARRLWRLPIRVLRAQIRVVIASRDAGLYPQLAAPA